MSHRRTCRGPPGRRLRPRLRLRPGLRLRSRGGRRRAFRGRRCVSNLRVLRRAVRARPGLSRLGFGGRRRRRARDQYGRRASGPGGSARRRGRAGTHGGRRAALGAACRRSRIRPRGRRRAALGRSCGRDIRIRTRPGCSASVRGDGRNGHDEHQPQGARPRYTARRTHPAESPHPTAMPQQELHFGPHEPPARCSLLPCTVLSVVHRFNTPAVRGCRPRSRPAASTSLTRSTASPTFRPGSSTAPSPSGSRSRRPRLSSPSGSDHRSCRGCPCGRAPSR